MTLLSKRESGHAAMLFAMFIPILFGLFTLASDGARALQDKARLNEALEVASLAVSAQDSEIDATRKATAKAYIQYFFPNSTVTTNNISVTKVTCDEDSTSSGCDYDAEQSRYFEYTVTGTITNESWFPGDDVTQGLGDTYNLASSAIARKYQSETIDIVYVADFSGSMDDPLKSATGTDIGKKKYVILKQIINEVNEEIKEFNEKIASVSDGQSKVGFSAFNKYTHGTQTVTYRWRGHTYTYEATCNVDNWIYAGNQLDEYQTVEVDNIFGDRSCGSDNSVSGSFSNIPLTDDFGSSTASFESSLNYFGPGGNTSSTQGLIQGAKIIKDGVNPRKLIIILSDGQDYPSSQATSTRKLVSAGLCDNIRDYLDSQIAYDDTQVKSRIALIGFDYNVSSTNAGLTTCVGGSSSSNIYQASSSSALKTAILSLISEEIGHLAN